MGHSGAGKTPLSDLFDAPGLDPFRIRPPRDENDKAMSKNDFHALLEHGHLDGEKRGKLVYPSPGNDDADNGTMIRKKYDEHRMCICERWSFFKVRTADQCLRHTDFNPTTSMRIEVFAPVLFGDD